MAVTVSFEISKYDADFEFDVRLSVHPCISVEKKTN